MKQFDITPTFIEDAYVNNNNSVEYVKEQLVRQILLNMIDFSVFGTKYKNYKDFTTHLFKQNVLYIDGIENKIKSPKDYPFYLDEFLNIALYNKGNKTASTNLMLLTTLRLAHLRSILKEREVNNVYTHE